MMSASTLDNLVKFSSRLGKCNLWLCISGKGSSWDFLCEMIILNTREHYFLKMCLYLLCIFFSGGYACLLSLPFLASQAAFSDKGLLWFWEEANAIFFILPLKIHSIEDVVWSPLKIPYQALIKACSLTEQGRTLTAAYFCLSLKWYTLCNAICMLDIRKTMLSVQ